MAGESYKRHCAIITECRTALYGTSPEAQFLDVIWTKILRVFFLAIHSHMYVLTDFSTPPPTPSKSSLKLVCSENSQDYAQKPQRNYTFMNSASGLVKDHDV
jgi:hypothetical protein